MDTKNLVELVTFLKRDYHDINKKDALTVLSNVIDTERYTRTIVSPSQRTFIARHPTTTQLHINTKNDEIKYVRYRIITQVNKGEQKAVDDVNNDAKHKMTKFDYKLASDVLKDGLAALKKLNDYKGNPIVYGKKSDQKIHHITLYHIKKMIKTDIQNVKQGIESTKLYNASHKAKPTKNINSKLEHTPVQLSLGI